MLHGVITGRSPGHNKLDFEISPVVIATIFYEVIHVRIIASCTNGVLLEFTSVRSVFSALQNNFVLFSKKFSDKALIQ